MTDGFVVLVEGTEAGKFGMILRLLVALLFLNNGMCLLSCSQNCFFFGGINAALITYTPTRAGAAAKVNIYAEAKAPFAIFLSDGDYEVTAVIVDAERNRRSDTNSVFVKYVVKHK